MEAPKEHRFADEKKKVSAGAESSKKKTAADATVLNPLPVFSCNTHASACMAEWPARVFWKTSVYLPKYLSSRPLNALPCLASSLAIS